MSLHRLLFAALTGLLTTLGATAQQPTWTLPLPSGETLQATACTDAIFRIRISPSGEFPETLMERYGILKTDWPALTARSLNTETTFTIATATHALCIDKATGAFSLKDLSGNTLVSSVSFAPGGSDLSQRLCDVIMAKYGNLKVQRNSPIIGDDDGTLSEKDKTEAGDPAKSCVIRIALQPGERFYGGGSTSREHIQHRGEILRMWATYQRTEIPMPFMMSSRGWGIYSNSTRKSYFDVGASEADWLNIYTTAPEADFFLMAGGDMPGVLNAYTLLTGRNYLLPKWAYGFCFGPNMKENQWDILRDAVSLREMGMPGDVMWLEPQWMSKHYDFSTAKKWNYDKFTPEFYWKENKPGKKYYPSLFIGKLRDMGYHLGLWVCEEYDLSIAEEDALPGATPSGQEHWMDHLKQFVDMGAEGFKLDPARTLDEHLYRKYYNGHPDKEMHNLGQVLLPKQMNRMYREHTGKRGWYHYCGGWSGTQHWGASTSGDNGGGKVALFDQLNLGMSGYMNTSCDVMFVDRDQEMQSLHFGTFLPWLQVNSWCSMMHPFYYTGKERETYLNCIRLRYELMPYVYSTAIEGVLTGMPMVRSMPLVFPDDRKVDDLWEQYMFGPSLCVGIFTDEIYLPAGEWTDFWTGRIFQSKGETVRLPYPDDRAGLLFVRGGAIIPMAPGLTQIGTEPLKALTVHVWPSGDSSYTMYDCDAESYGYEEGRIARSRFDCSASRRSVTFTVSPVEGSFENMPPDRDLTLVFHLDRKPAKVLLAGKKTTLWSWTPVGDVSGAAPTSSTKMASAAAPTSGAGTLTLSLPDRSVRSRQSVTLQF
ncbi:MAG: glycoside hydrolase family 31 protein [Bacteroidales bacterium]|nr:glycoside hydrolase family 31 protein [Bacteroidales bacterium]